MMNEFGTRCHATTSPGVHTWMSFEGVDPSQRAIVARIAFGGRQFGLFDDQQV